MPIIKSAKSKKSVEKAETVKVSSKPKIKKQKQGVEYVAPTIHKLSPKFRESLTDEVREAVGKALGVTHLQAAESLSSLTAAQRKVAELVGEGWRASEIASELKISPKTVDVHRGALMAKLGIKRPKDLILLIYADKLN